jgi:NAD(P)-dependent dehydrogenase (short-subunit alcohol dehydrogenase family)
MTAEPQPTTPPDSSPSLSGRRVLVTGGSMGIGLEVSRELARRGARVVIGARGAEAVNDAVASLEGLGHQGLVLDVSEPPAWEAAMKAIDAQGPLHGLVAAAGILGPIGRLDELPAEQLVTTIAINLVGTMLALRYALPRLRLTRGRAVTFSGGGGTAPLSRYDAYAASKAGVVRLTENVASSGEIEINSVAPGFVITRMHEETLHAGPQAAGERYHERTKAQMEQGGFPASEAAALVCFLLSEAATGISGRLLSAQWDPWRDPGFLDQLRANDELATLRRIDGMFFGPLGSPPS